MIVHLFLFLITAFQVRSQQPYPGEPLSMAYRQVLGLQLNQGKKNAFRALCQGQGKGLFSLPGKPF